jgi:GNAT superfamily N-acetyltransferase
MKQQIAVTIKPLAEDEIETVESHLSRRNARKHRIRFDEQLTGDALYLIAWKDLLPIGHVFIKWHGAKQEQVRTAIKDCPHLEDLYVLDRFQHQGIGTAIMQNVEEKAKVQGFRIIGLAVGLTNSSARTFYEKLGYKRAAIDPYWVSWGFLDEDGKEQIEGALCDYYIKQLR